MTFTRFSPSFFRWLMPCFLSLGIATAAPAYTIPQAAAPKTDQETLSVLQKMSKGVASIAKQANQAIVFVSVYKNAPNMPQGMVDPFEFFFGPRSPFGGPRGMQPGPDDDGRGGPGGPGGPGGRREGGLGSGFIIDLKKGYILTNNHVVQGADEIQLKLANGDSYEGKIVGRDQNTDIAVVQIKKDDFNRKGVGELSLGNSDSLDVGDFVVALGAPFGLEASLSFGVVSALGRGNLDITKLGNFIQTDAAINPGNSGGPLLDMHGQVIGVNTAIYSRSGAYNGIGFAVPSNLVRNIAEQLVNNGHIRRGYLGVFLQPIDDELQSGLNLPEGVKGGALVARVQRTSPADIAGIEPGDVVTEVYGTAMKVHSEIVNTIGLLKPGSKIALTLYRDGSKKSVNVTVGEHPDDESADDTKASKSQGTEKPMPFGMSLSAWSKQAAARYNLESKAGAIITSVEPNDTADRAGLRPGDLILKVDNRKITSPEDFQKAVKGKAKILVWIERGGEFYFVQLKKS